MMRICHQIIVLLVKGQGSYTALDTLTEPPWYRFNMDSPITTSSPAGRTPVSRPSMQELARARNLSIGPRNLMEVREACHAKIACECTRLSHVK